MVNNINTRLSALYYSLILVVCIILYGHLGIVDEDTANVLEGVADAAQNQAEADRDATITDRLKMAGTRNGGWWLLPCCYINHQIN